MSVSTFDELRYHVGHKVKCVMYGDENVVIECLKCNEILVSYDEFDEEDEE